MGVRDLIRQLCAQDDEIEENRRLDLAMCVGEADADPGLDGAELEAWAANADRVSAPRSRFVDDEAVDEAVDEGGDILEKEAPVVGAAVDKGGDVSDIPEKEGPVVGSAIESSPVGVGAVGAAIVSPVGAVPRDVEGKTRPVRCEAGAVCLTCVVSLEGTTSTLMEYIQGSIACEIPVREELRGDFFRCPVASCSGTLQCPSPPELLALRKRPSRKDVSRLDPPVLTCGVCNGKFGPRSVIERVLLAEFERLGVPNSEAPVQRLSQGCTSATAAVLKCRQAISGFLRCMIVVLFLALGFPELVGSSAAAPSDDLKLAYRAALILDQNVHSAAHVGTCFTKGGNCRYEQPQQAVEDTKIEFPSSERALDCILVTHRRGPAFIYVSSTNALLHDLLCANNYIALIKDIKLTFYITGYCHKDQTKDTKVYEAVMARVQRFHKRCVANPDKYSDEYARGLGLILQASYGVTDGLVMGAPLAALENCVSTSGDSARFVHGRARVRLTASAFMEFLSGEVTVVLDPKSKRLSNSALEDWLFRPASEDFKNPYYFFERFRSVQRSQLSPQVVEFWEFEGGHSGTRVLVRRGSACVVVLLMRFAIPNRKLLDDDKSAALDADQRSSLRENYARFVLALGTNWRTRQDLLGLPGASWWEKLTQLEEKKTVFFDGVPYFLDNVQSQYEKSFVTGGVDALAPAEMQEFAERGVARLGGGSSVEVSDRDLDQLRQVLVKGDMAFDGQLANVMREAKIKCAVRLDRAPDSGANVVAFDAVCNVPKAPLLFVSAAVPAAGPLEYGPAGSEVVALSLAALGWLPDASLSSGVGPISEIAIKHPTIQQICHHWRTNPRQSLALAGGCLQVLDVALRLVYEQLASRKEADAVRDIMDKLGRHVQPIGGTTRALCVYVSGGAGRGKSHVIRAFRDFARAWKVDHSLMVLSTTGCSATLIRGVTWQSALGVNFRGQQTKVTDRLRDLRTQWKPVRIVILDEAARLNGAQFAQFEKALRVVTECEDPFGGLHVFLAGDLAQPYIAGRGLYVTTNPALDNEGIGKWKCCVNYAVELVEDVRAKSQEYSQRNDRLAFNAHTVEDCKWYNQRSLEVVPSLPTPGPGETVFVATTHKEVSGYNLSIIGQTLAQAEYRVDLSDPGTWRERGVLCIEASLVSSGGGEVTVAVRSQVMRGYYKQATKVNGRRVVLDVPPRVFVIVGSTGSYTVLENVDVARGVSHGTRCFVVDVLFSRPEEEVVFFRPSGKALGGGIHVVDARFVRGLLLEHHDEDWKQTVFHTTSSGGVSLPAGQFPLTSKVSTKLTVQMGAVSTSVGMSNLGLVEAWAVTGHSTQGLTLRHITVLDLTRLASNADGYVYLLFTRVATADCLLMVPKLPEVITKYSLRVALMRELNRVRGELCDRTYEFIHTHLGWFPDMERQRSAILDIAALEGDRRNAVQAQLHARAVSVPLRARAGPIFHTRSLSVRSDLYRPIVDGFKRLEARLNDGQVCQFLVGDMFCLAVRGSGWDDLKVRITSVRTYPTVEDMINHLHSSGELGWLVPGGTVDGALRLFTASRPTGLAYTKRVVEGKGMVVFEIEYLGTAASVPSSRYASRRRGVRPVAVPPVVRC